MDISPALSLHNTLTRQAEPVEPTQQDAKGHPLLRVYGCGPTVYSLAHIGNFRSFLTTDLLLRTARALDWRTKYVSNVTDVGHLTDDDVADASGEDKMAKALRSKEGERFANVWDLARHYTDALLDDWRALNLLEPDVRPRATEHVTEQIRAVGQLLRKEFRGQPFAYRTDKGVYFSVETYNSWRLSEGLEPYGSLSGNVDINSLNVGSAAQSRDIILDYEKRDPRDFAIWKRDPNHLMQWFSPYGGLGFPGWHIECSVMAQQYLGETIDVHTGGEDLIFPHHECEIAQAESLTGQPFARVWLHTRFLRVEGEKMSKSKGNFITVRDLIVSEQDGGRGIDPLAVRYALISGHYRKPFNFTDKNLKASVKHVRRIQLAYNQAEESSHLGSLRDEPDVDLSEALSDAYADILRAMCDDLNTPRALAALLHGVSLINEHRDLRGHSGYSARAATTFLDRANSLLGVVKGSSASQADDSFAAKVEMLLEERDAARSAKDWGRADRIRGELDALGVEVMDSPQGSTWRKKASV